MKARRFKYFWITMIAMTTFLVLSVATGYADLVSYWKFDDGTGTTATDSVGSNSGTLIPSGSGPTWTTLPSEVKIGTHALKLDGVNDYVSVSDNASVNITGAITIAAWFKRPANSNFEALVGRWSPNNDSYVLYLMSSNVIEFAVTGDGSAYGNRADAQSTVVIPQDTWTHIVATFDATNQAMTIYINGVASSVPNNGGNSNSNVTSIYPGLADLTFGSWGLWNSTVTNGILDEVGIWNNALTADQVSTLYSTDGGDIGKFAGLTPLGDGGDAPEPATVVGLVLAALGFAARRAKKT